MPKRALLVHKVQVGTLVSSCLSGSLVNLDYIMFSPASSAVLGVFCLAFQGPEGPSLPRACLLALVGVAYPFTDKNDLVSRQRRKGDKAFRIRANRLVGGDYTICVCICGRLQKAIS